jgi:nucleotide-binding universal stress UspA family protein
MNPYRTIVVGTNGSRASGFAVDQAARLAASTRARLMLVCAYTPHPRRDENAMSDILKHESHLVRGGSPTDAMLRTAADRARALGACEVNWRSVPGDPADALVNVALGTGADLMVVSGRTAARGLGALPGELARRCAVDLLVVHPTFARPERRARRTIRARVTMLRAAVLTRLRRASRSGGGGRTAALSLRF